MSNYGYYRIQLLILLLAVVVAALTGRTSSVGQPTGVRTEANAAASAMTMAVTDDPVIWAVRGRVSDRFGRGAKAIIISLEGPNGLKLYSSTGSTGGFSFGGLPAGGPYKITAPNDVLRYSQLRGSYPNPGWYTIYNLAADVDLNFAYTLSQPWVPPVDPNPGGGGGGGGGTGGGGGPGVTPGGPPVDGTILNPSFEDGLSPWQTSGIIAIVHATGVTNGGSAAKISPTSNFTAASLTQFVQLTPGATYAVTADFTVTGNTRAYIGIKWGNGEDGPAALYPGGLKKTVTLQFTVPAGVTQVGFQARAIGSAGNTVIVDTFTLKRLT